MSLIIPVYNEELNIRNHLAKYIKHLDQSKINFEIIIVESNSTDKTYNELQNFRNLTNLIFKFNYKDINSLKIISRKFITNNKKFKFLSNSWLINLEFLILISRSNLKVKQAGIKMKDRKHGYSKITIFDNIVIILELVVTRLNFFF